MTWRFLETQADSIGAAYWRNVRPEWGHYEEDVLNFAVERLLAAGRPHAAFQLASREFRDLRPKQLFRVMKAIAAGSGETPGTPPLEPHVVAKAFGALDQSAEIAVDEMAGLEFQYLGGPGRNRIGIPNLERQISAHPELFVHAIVFLCRRDDEEQDPDELRAENPELAKQRAERAYSLLEALSQIPGRDQQGKIDSKRLLDWVKQVRAGSAELGRLKSCDYQIGKLLARAPADENGVWPCDPVRQALERFVTERLCEGVRNGRYNLRGAHWRVKGGELERELATQYEAWARSLEFQYPKVSRILRDMARGYQNEASREDRESELRGRLLD